jgi:hypothetical protein
MFVRTHRDFSNYNAGFVALHNRGWHGMQFDLNYTYSKSLDQIGTVQNSASYYASSFNPVYEYGPSFFDRPHIFNGTYNYDLPFGHGHLLGSSSMSGSTRSSAAGTRLAWFVLRAVNRSPWWKAYRGVLWVAESSSA